MDFVIRADAPRGAHKRHWQYCVGSGHAALALRADYAGQLRFIHDTLGIRRVRFHGIFDDDMRTVNDLSVLMPVPGAEAFREYNFEFCGAAYDNVLAAGMKPFVELSFMPGKLAKREAGRPVEGFFYYRPKVVPPADDAAWVDYVQAFVRFLIHRYGAEEVRSWPFEVWNEPDLPGAFFNGTQQEYFHLYEITAKAIKAVDAAILVGGPSTSNSKWVSAFLNFCEKSGAPVDFVTTHQYAGDPLGGVEDQGQDDVRDSAWEDTPERQAAQRAALESAAEKTLLAGLRALMPDKSETVDLEKDVFPKNAHAVRAQAGNKPLYYTEWNENAIFSAYTNDTRKVAAYDVRMALEVADDVDGSSVWCFSDLFEELHPFPQEFHGGFGLMTQHGIPKPQYYALKMLADAGDVRLDLGPESTKGEVGIAAFEGRGELQVLLFRQKLKNAGLPEEKVRVDVELAGAPARVTVKRIDEDHGNPLCVWQEMGSPVSLNRAEVEAIRERSEVREEAWPYEWRNGVLTIEASLGVNDVYCFNISR